MNVLLIAPYVNLKFEIAEESNRREDFWPSAALLHLGAILRANDYEPTILDFNNSKIHFQRERYLEICKKIILESLNKLKPELMGVNIGRNFGQTTRNFTIFNYFESSMNFETSSTRNGSPTNTISDEICSGLRNK